MDDYKVTFHPTLSEMVKSAAEVDTERTRLQMVMDRETFERVRQIIEAQEAGKRAAFYGTVREAVCAGEDFSRVETIQDIGDIYARFIIGQAFGTA